jgi:hypothetical protein
MLARMKTRTKLLAPIAAVPMVVLVVLQACGGDTNNGSDASTDGTTGSDATPDVVAQDSANDVVQTSDGGCPTYTGSVEFCKAAVAKCNACPGSTKFTTCDLQNLDAVCNAAENVFSLAFANAESACATVCDSDASNACEKAAVADASLTNAQQKLVTDYCGRCGTSTGCAAQTAAGVVQYGDPVVTTIDQKCAPDAGGPDSSACAQFTGCAGTILLGALGSLPCADAASD